MRRTILAILAVLAALTAAVPAKATATPLRVLLVGDSITVGYSTGGGWRPTLETLFESVGQPVDFEMMAAGGWSTADAWPSYAAALLSVKPDLVLINLGTNDGWDVPGFESRYDHMIGATLDMSAAKLGLSFVQYSNLGSLATLEASVNDAIYRRLAAHAFINTATPNPRFAGLADFQDIPPSYLDSGGVHPTADGYVIYAHKLYDAVHGSFGLPAIPYAYPPLTGHRP